MNTKLIPTVLAIALLATTLQAQTSGGLNLKLPPGSVPASSSSTPAPAAPRDAPPAMDAVNARPSAAAGASRPAPGVYYGDTSRIATTPPTTSRRSTAAWAWAW